MTGIQVQSSLSFGARHLNAVLTLHVVPDSSTPQEDRRKGSTRSKCIKMKDKTSMNRLVCLRKTKDASNLSGDTSYMQHNVFVATEI